MLYLTHIIFGQFLTELWPFINVRILFCSISCELICGFRSYFVYVLILGHFHFKLEKKFPQGAKKKYPYIGIIYDFFCQKYSKLHGKNVGIDLNLVLPPFVPCSINHKHTSSTSNGAQVSYQELTLGTNFRY